MNSRFLPAASLSHQQNYVASDEDIGVYQKLLFPGLALISMSWLEIQDMTCFGHCFLIVSWGRMYFRKRNKEIALDN